MALQILENNGKFQVHGKITCKNALKLQSYFNLMITKKRRITINIDEVTEIDSDGLKIITNLYKKAIKKNVLFVIVGDGCRDVYEHFITLRIA